MTNLNLKYDPDYLSRMINEHEAAIYIGHSVRALQNWRVRGGGPQYIKVSGRSIRYRRKELNEWANNKLVSSTSEAANDR